ncbi:hypothetical protein [Spirulina sp. 06S082]|uniref:hypothetical protein n=1 Tax=Spirulina sp. 06S082 TaxID=3110248 RepID=UPI002B1FBA55|nr:hypothetical protein [Spirulina sp. 06S082]MEA5470301.1 hypothetical protein [Spirulina sp. 06S082]
MFKPSELPDSQTMIPMNLQSSIEKIFATGKITLRDRQVLQNALLNDSALTHEQSDRVRAIYDRVRMGFIRVVD